MKIVPSAIFLILTLAISLVISISFGTPLDSRSAAALTSLCVVALGVAVYCFVVSEWTGNYSQVDKLWSLAPIAYVWIVSWFGGFGLRLVVMGLLVTIWGLRLSFNFWLKGGYQWKFWEGEEDYRWKVLRNKNEFKPKWKWTAFNLLFVSGYQNALILMFTLPAIVALQFDDRRFGLLDLITTTSILFFIVFESVADWQQWRFQEWKRQKPELAESGEIPDNSCSGKDFLDQGLWAYSRHPNYFAEQAIWVCFYLFSVSASGQLINWSITGCLLLMILFAGSAKFSEAISVSKYPGYRDYQKRVPRFLPTGKKAGA